MEDVSFFVALGAGLASFISPCVLPLVPVYFASLVGPEILNSDSGIKRRTIFLHALSFVLGFTIVFTALGALIGLTGFAINPNSSVVRWVAGSLLVVFGLFMLASQRFIWLNFEKRLSPAMGRRSGYFRSFLTGGVFTVAWTPCVGPILGSIFTLAWSGETVWQGSSLLAVYSMGLGIPFLVIGFAFGTLVPFIKRLNKYSVWVYNISGLFLIAIGITVITGNMHWFIP